MKKWKSTIIYSLLAAFIIGNLYLTFKEDSKVHRSEWVNAWGKVTLGDVVETFQTEGVVIPAEEHPIYFDSQIGTFQQFLVKEGEKISAGTSLFEYSPAEIEEEKEKLEAEKSQLESEITYVDQHISTLNGLKKDLEKNEQNDPAGNTDPAESEAVIAMEKEIAEQELEKKRLNEEIKKFDTLIQKVESKKSQLSVASSYDGYIKSIQQDLHNPIMTIRSSSPAVQGVINEKQLQKTEQGQKVKVQLPNEKFRINGTIAEVASFPEQEPSVKRKSQYPFTIQLDQGEVSTLKEEPVPGTTAGLTVITNEALSVPVAPAESVVKEGKKEYMMLLTNKGRVQKSTVDTGLLVNSRQAVEKGLKDGDAYAFFPKKVDLYNTTFITPLDTTMLNKHTYNKMSKKDKWRYFLTGLL
ncbi:HlyD family secretion protein [Bacillus ectoiniformans]|uniref:efflux RND transporter periplasmic adaptor subunit n=1 Tax=Bacillus ectoiniformans TaxID=1494429 RepID=UPI0019587D5D|nr:HlyD family efflux transporter periplasmic adaptor subunit [Bacillus ectoiniformans]MBM7649316.1 HlyD family secretion protein [Bacillus ectoiniformans]